MGVISGSGFRRFADEEPMRGASPSEVGVKRVPDFKRRGVGRELHLQSRNEGHQAFRQLGTMVYAVRRQLSTLFSPIAPFLDHPDVRYVSSGTDSECDNDTWNVGFSRKHRTVAVSYRLKGAPHRSPYGFRSRSLTLMAKQSWGVSSGKRWCASGRAVCAFGRGNDVTEATLTNAIACRMLV